MICTHWFLDEALISVILGPECSVTIEAVFGIFEMTCRLKVSLQLSSYLIFSGVYGDDVMLAGIIYVLKGSRTCY